MVGTYKSNIVCSRSTKQHYMHVHMLTSNGKEGGTACTGTLL